MFHVKTTYLISGTERVTILHKAETMKEIIQKENLFMDKYVTISTEERKIEEVK